jgi:uncharacterized protein involved in exopolysaccharide biosynthesis
VRQSTSASPADQIDIPALIRRYRALIAINLLVACGLFVSAAFVLPQKFKSIATITIYTKYFQNPLVKDFLPELYDTGELKAQRENLIRQSFSDEWLNGLGDREHLFKSQPGSPERETDLEELRKRIETFSLQSTTFTVSFIHSDKKKTLSIEKEIVDRVIDTLITERRQAITKVRDSIQRRVEGISLTANNGSGGNGNPDPMASARPELLRKELAQLQEQVKALENQYTPQHPKVAKLRERMTLIEGWLEKAGGSHGKSYDKPVLIDGQPHAVTKEVYEDLLKKLNYLNILLDMDQDGANDYVAVLSPPSRPLSPVWPNKAVFLMWGMLTGLLVSAMVMLITEYFERTAPSVRDFARELELPYLGTLPKVPWGEIHGKPGAKGGGGKPAAAPKKKQLRFEEWN